MRRSFVLAILEVVILTLISTFILYKAHGLGRYKTYYLNTVQALETNKGTSTPDFSVYPMKRGESMVITLNKNMISSLDAKRKGWPTK